jgi:hypothetical protein
LAGPARTNALWVPFAAPLAALVVALGLSHLFASNPSESFLGLIDWMTALLLFLLVANSAAGEPSRRWLIAAVVPALWIEFGVVIQQVFHHHEPEKFGTLVNANILTAFVLPWIPALAHRALKPSSIDRGWRWFWGSGALAALVCLALARSTTGALCLLLGAPFLFGWQPIREWIRRWPRLTASLATLGAIVVAVLLWDKFTRVYDLRPHLPPRSSISRFLWWESAWRMFLDHPWTGIGVDNFPSAYLAYKVGGGEHTLYAHGFPAAVLAEMGLIGVTALAWWAAAYAAFVRRSADAVRERWPELLGALMLLGFSLINISLEYLVNHAALFVLAGLVVAPLKPAGTPPRRSVVVVLVALAVGALPFVCAPYMAGREFVQAREELAGSQFAAAERNFSAALAFDPRHWGAYQGRALARHGRFLTEGNPAALEEAFEDQRRAIERNRLNGFLWHGLAVYARELGRPDAIGYLRRALELHRTNPQFKSDLEKWEAEQNAVRETPLPRRPRS